MAVQIVPATTAVWGRAKSDKCVGHKKQITKHINQILKTDFQQNVLITHLKWSTPILTNALNLIEQKYWFSGEKSQGIWNEVTLELSRRMNWTKIRKERDE